MKQRKYFLYHPISSFITQRHKAAVSSDFVQMKIVVVFAIQYITILVLHGTSSRVTTYISRGEYTESSAKFVNQITKFEQNNFSNKCSKKT